MKTVILCGGQGTRLREETGYRPKPMVEVGGRPALWHIMKNYAHFGYKDFVLALGYKGELIKNYFLNYREMNNDFTVSLGGQRDVEFHMDHDESDYQVTLSDTGLDSMTGSRVKKIQKYIKDDHFMLTYGDGFCNVRIDQLIEYHKQHGKIATVTTVKPHSRFGVLHLKEGGEVSAFQEKTQIDGWISAGFFVFHRKVFDYLDEADDCILERAPLSRLAEDGQLMGFRHEGFFYAMDTYREYQHLNELWKTGERPWLKF